MKRHMALCPIMLSLLFLSAASGQDDPYSEALVRDALTSHVTTSFSEKALSRLGDRAAVGIIRTLDDRELGDPSDAKRILWLLETAFSVPENIQVREDRTPKATLFLLHYIAESPVGRGLADEIERTKHAIQSKQSGAQGSSGR
jgi:hypothetical protein